MYRPTEYLTQKVVVDLDSEPNSDEDEIPMPESEDESLKSFHQQERGESRIIQFEDTRENTENSHPSRINQDYRLVSEKFMRLNQSIDHLMDKNNQRMLQLRDEIKFKKAETKMARIHSRRFTKAIRNELVASIDREEAETPKSKFVDRGARVKNRNNSQNVMSRMCKSSRHENQPILWDEIIKKNQWYFQFINMY